MPGRLSAANLPPLGGWNLSHIKWRTCVADQSSDHTDAPPMPRLTLMCGGSAPLELRCTLGFCGSLAGPAPGVNAGGCLLRAQGPGRRRAVGMRAGAVSQVRCPVEGDE